MVGRILLVTITLLILTGLAGTIARANTRAKTPPPGQMIDVGGYTDLKGYVEPCHAALYSQCGSHCRLDHIGMHRRPDPGIRRFAARARGHYSLGLPAPSKSF
jgi:hypothetical protein